MGFILLNPPSQEMIDNPFLISHFKSNAFETHMKGITAYVAKRFIADVYARCMAEHKSEFWPINAEKFAELTSGESDRYYWGSVAATFHEALLTGLEKKPSHIRMHSIIGPVALSEHRFNDAVTSAFILYYLCLGGDIAPMIEQETKFSKPDTAIFFEVTNLLREHLNDALADLDTVFEENLKIVAEEYPDDES